MSSSSSNEEQPNQELDQMRERIRQYQEQVSQTAQLNRELQQKVDGLELELQVRSSLLSPLSPLPAQNLQPAMSSVATLDENTVQQMIINSQAALEIKIKHLMDTVSTLTQLIQTAPSRPLASPTPLGTASLGIPGLPSSSISNVLGGPQSNSTVILNDYAKAVEVEQRKLSDPVLTPACFQKDQFLWIMRIQIYIYTENF